MEAVKPQYEWTNFLKFFGKENLDRPTRIGLFETVDGVTNDYWIENGLPLKGIDVDFNGRLPVVEIMLEGLTHVVRNVKGLRPIYSFDGNEEGMDIIDSGGATTILRFDSGALKRDDDPAR